MKGSQMERLPKELVMAQEAVKTNEVRLMIKNLGKYGLGVYLPHMHKGNNDFYILPKDTVVVEDNSVITFVPRDAVEESSHVIATAWRWDNGQNDVSVSSLCGGGSGQDECIGAVVATTLYNG
jgi:hypothetical protein